MPVAVRILACAMLLPLPAAALEIDTEHLFGFMIGSDIGEVGDREFETRGGARLSRNGGHYRAFGQEFELELTPAPNFRVELGTSFAAHDIGGVAGLADVRQAGWQGASVDLRYRFLERERHGFGFTVAVEAEMSRLADGSGQHARGHGSGVTLAFDRELVPGYLVAALNLSYRPEWTRLAGAAAVDREATVGIAGALMAQWRPGVYLGAEARYLRAYEGIGLQEFSGDALFVGPTAYLQLTPGTRLTAAWSTQLWGRDGGGGPLNLAGFERHHARLIYGANF